MCKCHNCHKEIKTGDKVKIICMDCFSKISDLEAKLAEKDKEIERLKESNGVTEALYKNYYTQLQNYKSKLYNIDIPKLRKKHLTPEEKEIYYKGFENCERQISSHIADLTLEVKELKQQLAEKEEQIKRLEDFGEQKRKAIVRLQKNKSKINTEFAIQQLQWLKNEIKMMSCVPKYNNIHELIDRVDITNLIDQIIKELKGETE